MSGGGRIVVGITGASGAVYAQRLIGLLLDARLEVHLIVSPAGVRLLHEELGMEGVNPAALAQRGSLDEAVAGLVVHRYGDVGAPPASGSFVHDGMVIAPCSSNTLSAVATGSAQNLLHRAAQVTLKERRRLILLHREMPLSLVELRNLHAAAEAGAIVCPASPGFYMQPQRIEDLVDFVVGRVLDLMGDEHELSVRWARQGPAPRGRGG